MGVKKARFFVVLDIGLVVVLQLCLLASSGVVFQVEHKFSGKKTSLTQFKAHDSHRHRRILSAVHLPIGGDSNPTSAALYFTKIRIGTPRKEYHMQVDTGSDLLWVNCVESQENRKENRQGKSLVLYDPKASSTGKMVNCGEDICRSTLSGAHSNCKDGKHCSYSITYGDGSAAMGYFVVDVIQLDRVSGDRKTTSMNGTIAFGCGSQQVEESSSFEQHVDGILGFGQADSSMLSQLASANKVKKIFSHCLDGSKGGGIFAIGEVVNPKVKTTPMIAREHYSVELKAIQVGRDVLKLPTNTFSRANQETIIDSGTTLAYLPNLANKQVINKIVLGRPNIQTHIVDQQFTCFKYSGNVDKGFPDVTFQFQNSLTLKVYPRQYLFEYGDQEWCIGFLDSNLKTKDGKDITLLGDLVLTDKLITYDIEKKTIGWIEQNCSSSIKVKDEESKKAYVVGARKLSQSSHINVSIPIIVTCFMFVVATTFSA